MENIEKESRVSDVVQPYTPQVSTQPPHTTHQVSTDNKLNKHKNIFIKIVISLLVLGFIAIGITMYWKNTTNLVVSNLPTTSPTLLQQTSTIQTTETPTSQVSEGTQILKVAPRKSKEDRYLLADKETMVVFGRGGYSKAVPDVVFGENYSLNDIHNINYLPIRNELSFYNKGYFISLKNQGCNTERRFTDVPEIWVTDCSIQVIGNKKPAPIKKLEAFNRSFNTGTSFVGLVSKPNDPLIYISVPKGSLQNFSSPNQPNDLSLEIGSMTSYGNDTLWNTQIITSYGIETISYTATDVWNKTTKQVVTGPLTTISKIDNLNCRVVYTGDKGQQTDQCEIVVNLSFAQDETKAIPIKLATFSE